jgi:TolB protein
MVGCAIGALLFTAGCGSGSGGDATTASARVNREAVATFPAADGRIAFRRYFDAQQSTGAVFTINPDGSKERQVTRPPANTLDDQPAWAPGGKLIAFSRCAPDSPCSVWTVKPDGSDARPVVRCGKREPSTRSCPDAGNQSFAPDGRHIVLTASYGPVKPGQNGGEDQIENSEIMLVDLHGRHPRSLVKLSNFAGDADWGTLSPDGKTLVYERRNSFRSKPAEGRALFAVSTATGHQRRITKWSLDAGDGADWSPDGSKLVFRSNEASHTDSDYYTVRADGSGLTRLTHLNGKSLYSASWSPDGRWIAFATDGKAGAPDVFTMRADGSQMRPVTRTSSFDSAPDWGSAAAR